VTPGPAPSPYQVAAGPVRSIHRRALIVLVGYAAPLAVLVLAVLLPLLGPAVAGGAAAAVWLVLVLFYMRSATRLAVSLVGASPADPDRYPRLFNLTESLCVTSGLPKPDLMVVDSERPNSFSVGLAPSSAVVVVTSALAETFTRLEMEATLAHELSHIRRGDTAVASALAAVLWPWSLYAPRTAARLAAFIRGDAESSADVAAIGLTRYPPALLSALRRMDAPLSERAPLRSVDLLWNAAPRTGADALGTRIEALLEL